MLSTRSGDWLLIIAFQEVLSSGHQRSGKVTCYPFSFPLGLSWLFTLLPLSDLLFDILICGLFSFLHHLPQFCFWKQNFLGLWILLEPKILLFSRPWGIAFIYDNKSFHIYIGEPFISRAWSADWLVNSLSLALFSSLKLPDTSPYQVWTPSRAGGQALSLWQGRFQHCRPPWFWGRELVSTPLWSFDHRSAMVAFPQLWGGGFHCFLFWNLVEC